MRRFNGVLVIGACLLSSVGLSGQDEARRGRLGAPGQAPAMVRPIEQDSAASSSSVASRPQDTSQAIVPRLVKFNGVLRDITGKPLSGSLDVTFALYDKEAGGEPLWFETQTIQADEQGRYTALVGAMHDGGLPMELFVSGEARWLGVQVGQEADQQPRTLLVSVAYALKAGDADTLGGKPASAYVLGDAQTAGAPTGTATAGASAIRKGTLDRPTSSQPAAVATSPVATTGGTANSLAKFFDATTIVNSSLFENGGNVEIGTTSPANLLHIAKDGVLLSGGSLINTQLKIRGSNNVNQQLLLGYDTTNDIGVIQSQLAFVAFRPLVLNPNGGNIGIGTASPVGKTQIVTASNTAPINLASWDGRHVVIGGSGVTGGIGISYDQTNQIGYIQAATPNFAWRNLALQVGGAA